MTLGRLGRMAYINTLPVDWGLVNGTLGRSVTVYRGAPTTLNRLLAEGRLDVSPVSSVATAEHAEEWLVFDNLCIGSRGEVGSVILDSSVPIEELEGASIAVTADSATAAQLLRILLARHWKIRAELIKTDSKATARLLIGDPALKTAQSRPSGFIYDLGQCWREYTGRDFVFGLWCVRKAFVEEHPAETRELYRLLQTSRGRGQSESSQVVAEAARVTGLTETQIESYFDKLVFDLDDELWSGLEHFLALLGYGPGLLQRYREGE
jgi:chorismate dehydratase